MSQSPQVVWVREPPSPFPATYHMDVPWGPNPTARTTSASTPMEHSGFPKVIFHPSLLHGAGVSHQALNPQTQQLSHYASLSPPKKKNPFHPPQGCSPGEGFRVSPIPKPPSSAAQPLAPKPHLQPPTPTMLQDDPEAPSPTISANVGYLSPPKPHSHPPTSKMLHGAEMPQPQIPKPHQLSQHGASHPDPKPLSPHPTRTPHGGRHTPHVPPTPHIPKRPLSSPPHGNGTPPTPHF